MCLWMYILDCVSIHICIDMTFVSLLLFIYTCVYLSWLLLYQFIVDPSLWLYDTEVIDRKYVHTTTSVTSLLWLIKVGSLELDLLPWCDFINIDTTCHHGQNECWGRPVFLSATLYTKCPPPLQIQLVKRFCKICKTMYYAKILLAQV